MASALSGGAAVTEQRFTDWKAILDPEFRRGEFPGLETPRAAVVRWIEVDEREQPTGNVQENPEHRPGPLWKGLTNVTTPATKAAAMRVVGWIDVATMRRLLLDCEVLVPLRDNGELELRRSDGRDFIPVHTTTVPPGVRRWRRIRVRDLLGEQTLIRLDAGWTMAEFVDFSAEVAGLERDPDRYVDEQAPEVSPRITELAAQLDQEYRLETGLVATRLRAVADWSRANGFALTAEECERYARGYARWVRNLRLNAAGEPVEWPDDLFANGLITHYDDGGAPAPVPWTLGKFEHANTGSGRFAWHRVLGAYVGFAVGECLALGNGDTLGPAAQQLLRHSETVMRGLPFMNVDGVVPAGFPPPPNPGSWLSTALGEGPGLPPNPLAAALPVTMVAGFELESVGLPLQLEIARALTDAEGEVVTAVDLLVRMFTPLLATGEFPEPIHIHLERLRSSRHSPANEIAAIVLAMREGRDIPDAEQIETLGDPSDPVAVAARAIFAAAKRHYDPWTALQTACRQSADPPLTAALTGAVIGARLGVPGFPAELVTTLRPLGVVDNVASDIYRYFNLHGVAKSPSLQERWAQRYPRD